jgi:hypothetical protein
VLDLYKWLANEVLHMLLSLVIIAVIIGAAVWWLLPGKKRPSPPLGRCADGTNCRAFLPHNSYDLKTAVPPPMCATCPFVNRM